MLLSQSLKYRNVSPDDRVHMMGGVNDRLMGIEYLKTFPECSFSHSNHFQFYISLGLSREK